MYNSVDYIKCLIQNGDIGLILQDEKGKLPSGYNGPHQHEMTPVRNISHWAITFSFLYKKTSDNKYKKAAEKCYNILMSKEFRKEKCNYISRTQSNKNAYNGLVGPAWVIESFYFGHLYLEDVNLIEHAHDFVKLFHFDFNKCLWNNLDENGVNAEIEETLNQQIWFTACASKINSIVKDSDLELRINKFNSKILDKIMTTRKNIMRIRISKSFLRDIKYRILNCNNKELREKEFSYHIFTLVAFGYLKEDYPDLPMWKSKKFQKYLDALNNAKLKLSMETNNYGYGYNMTGFELMYLKKVFQIDIKDLKYFETKQMEGPHLVKDIHTFFARQYELTRVLK